MRLRRLPSDQRRHVIYVSTKYHLLTSSRGYPSTLSRWNWMSRLARPSEIELAEEGVTAATNSVRPVTRLAAATFDS